MRRRADHAAAATPVPPRVAVFAQNAVRYDRWFDDHPIAYQSELEAIRSLLPRTGECLEVGIGTGRFAQPLGVRVGVDPSPAMARLARGRGLDVHEASAETLPFAENRFDSALMVTTLCFLDDVGRALREIRRVLKPGGALLVAFIDRNSRLGRLYEARRQSNVFYREARFYAARDVMSRLHRAGYAVDACAQKLMGDPRDLDRPSPVRHGIGRGAFVVVRALKRIRRTECGRGPAVCSEHL